MNKRNTIGEYKDMPISKVGYLIKQRREELK